jgi:hypothetical protein
LPISEDVTTGTGVVVGGGGMTGAVGGAGTSYPSVNLRLMPITSDVIIRMIMISLEKKNFKTRGK